MSVVYDLIGLSTDISTFSICTQRLFQRSLAVFSEGDPQVTSHVGYYCWCFLTLALNWSNWWLNLLFWCYNGISTPNGQLHYTVDVMLATRIYYYSAGKTL